MSRWHRENPELYEQGYEPWADIERIADELRKDPTPAFAVLHLTGPLRFPADQRHAEEERLDKEARGL